MNVKFVVLAHVKESGSNYFKHYVKSNYTVFTYSSSSWYYKIQLIMSKACFKFFISRIISRCWEFFFELCYSNI